MKKALYSLIVCLCYAFSLNAQINTSVFLGEMDGNFFIWETRTAKKGGLYPPVNHFILKFDQSMNLISSAKFETNPAKGDQIMQMNKVGEKIAVISLILNVKKKTISIWHQVINPRTLEFEEQKTQLIELYLREDKTANFATFKYAWSDDFSKLLILRETLPKLFKSVPKTFDVSVFDKDLQLLWNRKETLSVTDKNFGLFDYLVSNNGDVNITGFTKFDKDTLQTNLLGNYLFLEFRGNGKKFEVRNFGIEIENYKIKGEQILFTSDKIIAAGFYQLPDIKNQYGYFLHTYNLINLKREKKHYSMFTTEPESVIDDENDPELRDLKDKDGEERFAFDIKRIRRDQWGNIFLIGEQRKTINTYTAKSSSTKEFYLDIYALKLDPQGKLIWEKRIPKRQVFTPTATKNAWNLYDFASFATCIWNGNLLFVLNDNPESLETATTKSQKVNWKDALSMMVMIDQDGKVSRKVLSNVAGNLVYTDFFYKLSEDRILVRSSNFKEYEESDYKAIDLKQVFSD